MVAKDIENPVIASSITDVLTPHEFTRLDDIIELVFFAAEDASGRDIEDLSEDSSILGDVAKPVAGFNDECASRCSDKLGISLVRRSRTLYTSPDSSVQVLCLVSRRHERGNQLRYWYAFRDHHKDELTEATKGFVALGCGTGDFIVMIPWKTFESWLPNMNVTTRENGRFFWHVHAIEGIDNLILAQQTGFPDIQIDEFVISRPSVS